MGPSRQITIEFKTIWQRQRKREGPQAVAKNDASRVGEDPQPTLALPSVGSTVQNALLHNQSVAKGPQFMAVREQIRAWEALDTDQVLLSAIRHGIHCPLVGIPRPTWRPTSLKDQELLMPTIQEYLSAGVIK